MAEPKATSGRSTASESSRTSPKLVTASDRQLLTVELRMGETTYVSWKKLMKEASNVNCSSASMPDPPPNANPNLESRLAPGHPSDSEKVDQPNRFSAVVEKIERLYMGKDSSDGEELDSSPDDDEYDTEDSFIDDAELDEYFEVDNSKVKHDGFFVNRGKLERMEPSKTSNQQTKKRQRKESAKPNNNVVDVSNEQTHAAEMTQGQQPLKKKSSDRKAAQDSTLSFGVSSANASVLMEDAKYADTANHQPKVSASHKSKEVGSSDALHHKFKNKDGHQKSKSLPGKSPHNILAETLVRKKEKNDMHDQLNATTGSRQPTRMAKPVSANKKNSSQMRPKPSSLEKAIKELEKVVAESRPSTAVKNQEADTSSQAVKRRLPREVKLKLAKVARIAACQGKVSPELIKRLMSIVGHLIQLRSLKRNLKIMMDVSMSAKSERDHQFQGIKKEVIEMIKAQSLLMESQATEQAGTSDGLHDAGSVERAPSKKFAMNVDLENKICDLYDIFVDGLEEDEGSLIRKLYVELAELWPNQVMDNHGIKRAICRAKGRKQKLYENTNKAKMKKKKQSVPRIDEKGEIVEQQDNGNVGPTNPTTVSSLAGISKSSDSSSHEKLKGSLDSIQLEPKTELAIEEYTLPQEKQLVLALTSMNQPKPQKPNAPHPVLDLNQST